MTTKELTILLLENMLDTLILIEISPDKDKTIKEAKESIIRSIEKVKE